MREIEEMYKLAMLEDRVEKLERTKGTDVSKELREIRKRMDEFEKEYAEVREVLSKLVD